LLPVGKGEEMKFGYKKCLNLSEDHAPVNIFSPFLSVNAACKNFFIGGYN